MEEYKAVWSNLMEYELYSQLTSEHKHSTFMSNVNKEILGVKLTFKLLGTDQPLL